MIRINLTGDYHIESPTGTLGSPELVQLDAFLGALRNSVDSNGSVFLSGLSKLVSNVKRKKLNNVALQITSELAGSKLTHEFRLVEID